MSFISHKKALLVPPIDQDALKHRASVIAAGGTYSRARLQLNSRLIRALKAATVWSSLDRLWLFAAENSHQALIDLVVRSTATATNSPTFAANQGYAGNGTTSYVDTNFNLSTAAKYTQEDAHWSLWRRTASNTGGSNANDGAILLTPTRGDFSQFLGPSSQALINGAVPSAFTAVGDIGSLVASRTTSTACIAYYNGVAGVTETTASTALPNLTFWIGGRNFNGSINNPGNHQTLSASFGSSLSAVQALAFHNALSAYKRAVGA